MPVIPATQEGKEEVQEQHLSREQYIKWRIWGLGLENLNPRNHHRNL
jgi:hypothetical protein